MQLLRPESRRAVSESACARATLDAVPIVMAAIRGQMRTHRSGLTVPQFRTLYFVTSGAGHSLSDAADFIGLSLPAMGRLVDGLVEKGLMDRKPCDTDRRHVRLSLTAKGEETLAAARGIALERLVEVMQSLTPDQRRSTMQVMELLRERFVAELPGATPEVRGCPKDRA